MSHNPKTVQENAKLTQAEAIMRKHNVHSIVVVNSNNEFVGMIDMFSCI
jgi:arabinose-5-phosphate isomerase